MERHAFAMKVKEGKMNDYRKTLGEIWPELTAYLDRNGIHNFSIWNAADLIFGYYENADGAVISPKEEKVKAALTEKIQDTFTWISTPGKDMRLMYHNFGVVRENKELIRHYHGSGRNTGSKRGDHRMGNTSAGDHGLDHQRCGLDDKRSTSVQCTSCMA